MKILFLASNVGNYRKSITRTKLKKTSKTNKQQYWFSQKQWNLSPIDVPLSPHKTMRVVQYHTFCNIISTLIEILGTQRPDPILLNIYVLFLVKAGHYI